MKISKYFYIICICLFAVNTAIGATLIAPYDTKFNVRFTDKFETLNIGDYKKFPVNKAKNFKNKKINWQALNVDNNSEIFFTGIVSDVKKKKLSNSNDYYYTTQFDINELAVDGISYKVKGKIHSLLDSNVTENLTNNYNIILLEDLTNENKQGNYTDKTEYYKKIQTNKLAKTPSNTEASKIEPKKKSANSNIKVLPYPTKLTYPNWYYNAAKKCEATFEPGNSMKTPYTCMSMVIQNDVSIISDLGYTQAVLPFIYTNIGQFVIETEQSLGMQSAYYMLVMMLSSIIAETPSTKITPEISRQLKTGK